jgi:hypothetical protein
MSKGYHDGQVIIVRDVLGGGDDAHVGEHVRGGCDGEVED